MFITNERFILASTTLSSNEVKTVNSHSPTNSAKNCRKISPTNNHHPVDPIQNSLHTQQIEIPPLDQLDSRSNHSANSGRKLTAVSENNSDTIFADNHSADPTLSLNSTPRKPSSNAAFGLVERPTNNGQRQFQKFSLVDNYNGSTPYVKLTPRSARSMDATLGLDLTSTLDAVEESKTEVVDVKERQPNKINRFISPKTVSSILPNADNLRVKKKSGVNVPVGFLGCFDENF